MSAAGRRRPGGTGLRRGSLQIQVESLEDAQSDLEGQRIRPYRRRRSPVLPAVLKGFPTVGFRVAGHYGTMAEGSAGVGREAQQGGPATGFPDRICGPAHGFLTVSAIHS